MLKLKPITRIIISSVVGEGVVIEQLKKHFHNAILFSIDTPLPFKLDYDTPNTLGVDRIAAAAGALEHFTGPLLIIDAGSCITCDLVDDDNIYRGGHISPGVQMRLDAMHTFTSNLPLLKSENAQTAPGRSTDSAMMIGATTGARFEIEGFITYYKTQYPDLKVILCGGDAKYFDKIMEFNTFALPNLVLEGLNSILTFNSEK